MYGVMHRPVNAGNGGVKAQGTASVTGNNRQATTGETVVGGRYGSVGVVWRGR